LARDFAGGGVDLPVADEELGGWLLGHSDLFNGRLAIPFLRRDWRPGGL
jgi:hypothetical protein